MGGHICRGDALDLIQAFDEVPSLIATDPPYSFSGKGDEHALSATVAVVLRECAQRLRRNSWMLVFSAASWRSTAFMVEALRGVLEPVRIATWCKPQARSAVGATGWRWASVNVIAFRKGDAGVLKSDELDHITAAPLTGGRRAALPAAVALWAVRPFVVPGGLFLDPFAGSGALVAAAAQLGMRAVGFEKKDLANASDSARRGAAAEFGARHRDARPMGGSDLAVALVSPPAPPPA